MSKGMCIGHGQDFSLESRELIEYFLFNWILLSVFIDSNQRSSASGRWPL